METTEQFKQRFASGPSQLSVTAAVFDDEVHLYLGLRVGVSEAAEVLGRLEMPVNDYPLFVAILELGAKQVPGMEFHHKLICGGETYDSEEQRRNTA